MKPRARPRTPPAPQDQIERLIEELETELRALGLWEGVSPSAGALASQQPFCVDTLSFPQWLQWVFTPRVREAIRGERAMPERSDIHALAEEIFAGQGAVRLLALIKAFDEHINRGSAQLH